MKYLFITLLSVITLSAASIVSASTGNEGGINDCRYNKGEMTRAYKTGAKYDKDKWIKRLSQRLQLNKEQTVSIRGIIDNNSPQLKQLKNKMRDNRQQLRDLSVQTTFDEAVVQQLAEQQADYKVEYIVLRARMRYEIAKHLTDAQKEQYKTIRKKHRK